MKVLLAVLCLGVATMVRCEAQVINGEGTYEDGVAHVPPSSNAAVPTGGTPGRAAHDETKREDATRPARSAGDRK